MYKKWQTLTLAIFEISDEIIYLSKNYQWLLKSLDKLAIRNRMSLWQQSDPMWISFWSQGDKPNFTVGDSAFITLILRPSSKSLIVHTKIITFYFIWSSMTMQSYGDSLDFIWRRKWQSTSALLPGKSHGGRTLIGYSPWGRKKSDTTERLHFLFFLFYFTAIVKCYVWGFINTTLSCIKKYSRPE